MERFTYTDHGNDTLIATMESCNDGPETVLEFRDRTGPVSSVHLSESAQGRLIGWLLAARRSEATEPLETMPGRPEGYLLTLSGGPGIELSMSDSQALSATEMARIVEAAGLAVSEVASSSSSVAAAAAEREYDDLLEAFERALYPNRDATAAPLDSTELLERTRWLFSQRDPLLERVRLLTEQRDQLKAALEAVRANFFDIYEQPFDGHISSEVSVAIAAKIDEALARAQA